MARRSVLFSPGDQPELLRKAPAAGADVVVFDLEDAVVPARKAEARRAVNDVLTAGFDPDCAVYVRVSDDPTTDLEAVLDGDPRLDGIALPKAETAADVRELDERLDEFGWNLPVFALIETASGVLHAEDIAAAAPTTALAFGAEDLAADIGAGRTEEGTEVLYAREHTVLAAAAADIDAIDMVFTDFEDTDGLRRETEFAIDLGYDGKMAIHPAQVDVINDAYTPSTEQIEWARRVLDARESADAESRGVFRVDDEMIDAPLVARAERIVERARAAK